MRFQVQKTITFEVDTSIERKRISACFKAKKYAELRKRLLEAIDAIEHQRFKEAHRIFNDPWWDGLIDETPRREFIGECCYYELWKREKHVHPTYSPTSLTGMLDYDALVYQILNKSPSRKTTVLSLPAHRPYQKEKEP